jgi:Leucine-rich repeat (LRR) protein
MKTINSDVTSHLKSLTTLDLSANGIENLEGIQNLKRLKRLIAKNN